MSLLEFGRREASWDGENFGRWGLWVFASSPREFTIILVCKEGCCFVVLLSKHYLPLENIANSFSAIRLV